MKLILSFFILILLPSVVAADYYIDQETVDKCWRFEDFHVTVEFLDCYEHFMNVEYPDKTELAYGEYLLDRCRAHDYGSMQQTLNCAVRHKEVYFGYNDAVADFSDEGELVAAHKAMCVKRGRECSAYDAQLAELKKYEGFPGYGGLGAGVPDVAVVDKEELAEYFEIGLISLVELQDDGTYLISWVDHKKWFGVFKTERDREMVFDISTLSESRSSKSWWEFVLTGYTPVVDVIESDPRGSVNVKSADLVEFEDSLVGTKETLSTAMKDVADGFNAYDQQFNSVHLRSITVSDSLLENMESKADTIANRWEVVNSGASEYKWARREVDVDGLSEDSKRVNKEIEPLITAEYEERVKIDGCLRNMDLYAGSVRLNMEVDNMILDWRRQRDLVLTYGEAERWSRALEAMDVLHTKARAIVHKLETEDAVEFVPGAWEKEIYINGQDSTFEYGYRHFVNAEKGGDDTGIRIVDYQIDTAHEDEEFANLDLSEEIEEADSWYERKIGVCVGVFEG
jgi:hypothetical protein